jgi:DNA-binding beta-propeller fold protein YncE
MLAACAAGVLGCSPAPAGNVSSSIVLLKDGRLAVVNPDQGSISFVDTTTLQTLSTLIVGGDPRALIQLQSGAIWVATYHGGQIAIVDPSSGQVTTSFALCAGPDSLAESPDHTWVAVACEWSGSVVRVNPTTLQPSVIASGLKRPRGLAIVGSSVVVAEFTGGDVVEISGSGKRTTTSLVPSRASYRPALTKMAANLPSAVVPAFGYLFVPHELVNHTGDDTDEAVADDYGTVINGATKINAAATRLQLSGETVSAPPDTPPVYSRFDVPTHAFCGPVAAAPFEDRYLLVVHEATNDVAVLDTTATNVNNRLVGSFAVGAGPAGIAVDSAHSVAYVDNAIDNSISKLDLTQPLNTSGPLYSVEDQLVRGLPSPYSEAAQQGRRIFHDATNPHVTPSRTVACATCHPGGSDDGLVWFIHTPTIPLKRRRTPDLANSRTPTAPFHWDGEFADMTDLANTTVLDLMAGDDLVVDTTTLQPYVDEIVQPAVAPPQDAAAIAAGAALFNSESLGCAGCHSGSYFTDDLLHVVLNPMSLQSDDVFTIANTPGLFGVFNRAPYFHDGRSPDLHDLLTRPDAAAHGNTAGLSAVQINELVAYLQSL